MTMAIARWLHLHFDKGELTADRGEFGLDRGELAADRGGFGLERWGLESFRLQQRGPRASESARQLSLHRVVLLFDPAEQLRSLLDDLATSQPSDGVHGALNLGELQAQWVIAGTSLFALRHQLAHGLC